MIDINITEFIDNLLKYLKIVQASRTINVTSKGTSLATLVAPVTQDDTAPTKT